MQKQRNTQQNAKELRGLVSLFPSEFPGQEALHLPLMAPKENDHPDGSNIEQLLFLVHSHGATSRLYAGTPDVGRANDCCSAAIHGPLFLTRRPLPNRLHFFCWPTVYISTHLPGVGYPFSLMRASGPA